MCLIAGYQNAASGDEQKPGERSESAGINGSPTGSEARSRRYPFFTVGRREVVLCYTVRSPKASATMKIRSRARRN